MSQVTPSLPARLLAEDSRAQSFAPHVENLPPLAPIDWRGNGFTPPQPLETPAQLPTADVVVIVWADSEWAATHHVFCASAQSMPYSEASAGSFPGWQKDASDMITGPDEWTYWGYFRLVAVGDTRVLLYKSNTHLDYPGEEALIALTRRLASVVQPKLILSTGTAGGANSKDRVGTVPIVDAATRYQAEQPSGEWPTYASSWTAPTGTLDQAGFAELLMAIPITPAALSELAQQLNSHEGTDYTLEQLDPLGLNRPDPKPAILNTSGGAIGLLTASTFLVGTIDDKFASYACIEMDDAVIAAECKQADVPYGSVRNLSDPAQNPALPSPAQAGWGSAIYRTYGLYTSFNGALAAWAVIAG